MLLEGLANLGGKPFPACRIARQSLASFPFTTTEHPNTHPHTSCSGLRSQQTLSDLSRWLKAQAPRLSLLYSLLARSSWSRTGGRSGFRRGPFGEVWASPGWDVTLSPPFQTARHPKHCMAEGCLWPWPGLAGPLAHGSAAPGTGHSGGR